MNKIEFEEWRTIEEYPNYQISNFGRIKSLWFGREKILKQSIHKNGYSHITLHKEDKMKTFLTHRLVAMTFIPNPNNYPQVNHKDEVKTNNCISNLEWVTQEYNNSYGTRLERMSKTKKGKIFSQEHKDKISKTLKGRKLSKETKDKISIANKGKKQSQEHIEKRSKALQKPIVQIHKSGLIIGVYNSAIQASEILGIDNSNINKCCNGKIKSCGGYKWEYMEENKKAS